MAKNLNILVFVLLVANLLHGSLAQTRHVVGDTKGWTIPNDGASFYVNWASKNTFTVGDTIVFNFPTGAHDVAKVTKSAFDGCNVANTLSMLTNGPATVTLTETGQQYFICTFGTHCSLGQKVSINVVKASTSPVSAPKPSASSPPKRAPVQAPTPTPTTTASPTPAPAPTTTASPAPAPVTGPVTYTVGDTLGWTIPSNGAAAYTAWASRKSFKVGDILVFNFPLNAHNVEEVTKQKYGSCSSSSPIATFSNPPVRVTLNKTGTHYFICGVTGHCSAGQKLSINVGGGSSSSSSPATSPSPAATSPSPDAGATPPSSSGSPPPSSTVTPSSQSPGGSVSPPPENSGAASLGVAGLFVAFLSVAAAFFC
ncbi:unnamed protein product [Vicia faba]|uniref:Phytocyanin domain-containing protein n=1 Tax=Vicia faba TaxID=3906 RepID=A0AAV1ALU7_VICFA|nr:unnamed protein product [Vicia faba]